MIKKITAPLNHSDLNELCAGDLVLLSGTIYTARDAAHKRLCELVKKGEPLPFDIKVSVIYFVGPTPAK
ncbi:MAG: fumarate hydratase C-terminal domain-containing protein, partial [Oscillospiraceae bacterium]